MNRRNLLHAFACLASFLVVASAWTYDRSPGWCEVSDRDLYLASGADKNLTAAFIGDCDSNSNPGGGTVTCDTCTPASVLAGSICICCDGSGLVNMKEGGAGSNSVSGIAPNSQYQQDCGKMKSATCQMISSNPACGDPAYNEFLCKPVTEFLIQATTGG